jgi:hypothetical protein
MSLPTTSVVSWLDAKRVFQQFTLSRSVLARLVSDGKIRTCSLQEKGAARGKRLYDVSSIHECLNSHANAGKGQSL